MMVALHQYQMVNLILLRVVLPFLTALEIFYSIPDGIKVFNKNHAVVQNGTGLYGDSSSTQSAIIVPKPDNLDVYYIFTVDTSTFEGDPDRGLNYSKLTAVVKDCSDQSVWLMTFASSNGSAKIFDTFHAFEINTTGVIPQSVRSTFSGIDIEDPRGYLKISPDGTKLASANMKGGLFVYDFDALTGVVTNQQKVAISGEANAPYGVEFSPNSQYLYIHASNDIFDNSGNISSLLQYDMLVPKVSESVEIIDNRNIFRGALQLGANGKIYRTTAKNYFQGTPFLSIIDRPNLKGIAAKYMHDAVSLNGKTATQGLPPFIQSVFQQSRLISKSRWHHNFTLEAEALPGGIYTWEKDGIVIPNSGNILQVPIADADDSGNYRLSITTSNPADCPIIGEAQVKVVPLPEVNVLVLEQCDIDSNPTDGIALVNLEQAIVGQNFEFTFYANAQDQVNGISISDPKRYTNDEAFTQTLFYKVTNELGCEDFGELTLLINTRCFYRNPESPILICDDSAEDDVLEGTFNLAVIRKRLYDDLDVTFYADIEDASIEEHPIETYFTSSSTTIYARIENDNQCQSVEIIDLIVHPLPEVSLDEFYQVCTDGEPLQIDAPLGFDTYTWYDLNSQSIQEIGNAQQVSIANAGSFSLEVAMNYQSGDQITTCSTIIDFEISPSNRAVFEEITITDFSEINAIAVLTSGDGDYEYSLDGITYQDDTVFNDVAPGFYTVYVRDKKGCGISQEETAVVGFPKFFTPNGDGSNDTWQLIGANSELIQGVADSGWDGSINGDPLPASDYWFRVSVEGRKQFKGHFALKR
ncbi:hypothetical protein GQR58_025041 [Nymphon striatum]|nr:hypothetical protein GQR58_025041 [Nymphon striatum]